MLGPSGEQYAIENGALRATVTEVGATLRVFDAGDRRVLWGFGANELASAGRGQVLCPWPNRLEDGSFRFGDALAKAALDEPERHNAIHGLVRWLPWRLADVDGRSVCLSCTVVPQPGYPFRVTIEVTYELGDDGLTVTTRLHNDDEHRAPFGLGFHPYLYGGGNGIDDMSLEIAAKTHVIADDRGLPVGTEPAQQQLALVNPGGVAREDRRVSLERLVLDDCFTDLERDDDGRWRVSLADPSGAVIASVWADRAFTHAMCFTGDTLSAQQRRRAIAVEPMTCAPNALHTGEGVIVLEPDESFSCEWGIDVGR